jgi:tetratricopeptide (TPR) repeat protein
MGHTKCFGVSLASVVFASVTSLDIRLRVGMAVLLWATSPISGQERVVPNLLQARGIKEKGCGSSLNEKALALQEKGLDLSLIRGRNAEAITLLEEAVSLEPRLIPAYIQLTAFYNATENPKKSISLLTKAIDHCPHAPILHTLLATSLSRDGSYNSAIEHYAKARELGFEPDPSFFYNLGNSYYRIGDYDKALSNYREALKLDPNKLEALKNMVVAYQRKGDTKSARETAEILAKRDPGGEYAKWAIEALKRMK